jgi:predicted Na+-dependent transporter
MPARSSDGRTVPQVSDAPPVPGPSLLPAAEARPRWARARRALWVLAVVATVLNGFVVGYGAVWFQLFGDQADRGDYLTSAGGYLGAAAVLALAPLAMLSPQQRRWAGPAWSWCAAGVAFVMFMVGLGSLFEGLALPGETGPFGGIDDGLGGVVLWPWCWLLIWTAVRGVLDRLRRR